MKRSIIVIFSEENKDIFNYLDVLLDVDHRSLNLIIDGILVCRKQIDADENKFNKLSIEHVLTEESSESKTMHMLFDSIEKHIKNLNKESVQVKARESMGNIESGLDFIFIGRGDDPLFLELLNSKENLSALTAELHNNVYIFTIFTKDSFSNESLDISIDVANCLNELNFPGLGKKVIVTDLNDQGSLVSNQDILNNVAVSIFDLFFDNFSSEFHSILEPANIFSYGDTKLSINFLSVGNSTIVLPIEQFRCNLSKKLTDLFAKKFFEGNLDNRAESIKETEYNNAKQRLSDLISYDYLFDTIRDKLNEIRKEEGIFLDKLKNLKNIPISSLVETLVNYHVLLWNSDLHLAEQALNQWINNEWNIDKIFQKRVEDFETLTISKSKSGFMNLPENFRRLKNEISTQMKMNLPLKRKNITSENRSKWNHIADYRSILTKKIKDFPKTLPYYIKFFALGVFLGYSGFLLTKILSPQHSNMPLMPYAIATIAFTITLFIAWFNLWKKKQEILFLAEAWRTEIEDKYFHALSDLINKAVRSTLETELNIVEKESQKCNNKINVIKDVLLEKVIKIKCLQHKFGLRMDLFGEDYYNKNVSKKILEDKNTLIKVRDDLKTIKMASAFFNSEETYADSIISELLSNIRKAIRQVDTDINLASLISDNLIGKNNNFDALSTIENLFFKSSILVSINPTLLASTNIIKKQYLLLPAGISKSDMKLLSKEKSILSMNIGGIYQYGNSYALTVLKVMYDFPIRSVNYFANLLNESNDDIGLDNLGKIKKLFGKNNREEI